MRKRGGIAGFRALSLCGAALILATTAARGGEFDLAPYSNNNRLVFVFAPNKANAFFRRQAELWNGKRAGLEERDLVRFDVFERGVGKIGVKPLAETDASALRKQFKVRRGAFRVILVGKDGHTAFASSKPVSAASLFGLIDAMPMRQQEMKKNNPKP